MAVDRSLLGRRREETVDLLLSEQRRKAAV